MLSILIPTYNYNCSKLCFALYEQALALKVDFEILVYDDASPCKCQPNKELMTLPNVRYKELEYNYGRSAIRNLMVKESRGEYILFLDCDGQVASQNYLVLYNKFKDDADIVCGGRIYPERNNIYSKYILHWLYGTKRESRCNRCEAKSFMTNNFLISRKAFESTYFDERMSGYGHEDTIFGIELKQKGYKFKMIKNPIIHMGLYDADKFIENTQNSIDNLIKIVDKKYPKEEFFDISLVRAYYKTKSFGLKSLMSLYYTLFHSLIERNLKSLHPSLFLLDTYKLGYYCAKVF